MGFLDGVKKSLGMDAEGHKGTGEPKQREGESDEDFAKRQADEQANTQTAVNAATTSANITT